MNVRPLSPAEQALFEAGFRAGARTVLDSASQAAAAIEATSRRKVHEGFAVAALRGLIEGCAELLTHPDNRRPA